MSNNNNDRLITWFKFDTTEKKSYTTVGQNITSIRAKF